jgi:prephenate dehydratase
MIGLMENPRIAFQGERGAFSEEAAIKLFGEDARLVPCRTFEKMFTAVSADLADCALAPIENSLAGSVHRTYDLLLDSTLQISAEVVIPISHHLIGSHDASLETITSVESHPVALAQCERFFSLHNHLERLATDDTAASVRRVVSAGDCSRAAIAGSRAATIYGGKIICEHLEDHKENYTRFVLLTPARLSFLTPLPSARADKLSLVFTLRDQPGALYRALEPFARRGIDLLKIESRPIVGQPWRYRFYLDLAASTGDSEVNDGLAELREQADEVRLLGCYPAASLKLAGAFAGTEDSKQK